MTVSRLSPETTHRTRALAKVAMKVGVNIQPRQTLVIRAPIEAADFVNQLASTAYECGSGRVHCLYEDPMLLRLALTKMDPALLDCLPSVTDSAAASAQRKGAAELTVWCPNPDFGCGVDLERIARLHTAMQAARPADAQERTNASALPLVTMPWARVIRPELDETLAVSSLWDDVARQCLLDAHDPVAVWQGRLDKITTLCLRLDSAQLNTVQIQDKGTDIRIGLPTHSSWVGGYSQTDSGFTYLPVFPASTLSSLIDPARVSGTIVFNRPLILASEEIQEMRAVFDHGVMVELKATKGEETLNRLLLGVGSSGRATRLSSIGLPLRFQDGVCFRNPILDSQNALRVTLTTVGVADEPGTEISNGHSALAIDCFLGTSRTIVNGLQSDGSTIPVARNGCMVI